jgi:hypothetical protein
MATKAGVGKSLEPDATEAGAQAATAALQAAGVQTVNFVMVVSTMGYDHAALLAGVRSVTGDAPVVGCTGAGIITEDGPDDSLRRAEVIVIASDQITVTPVVAKGAKEAPEETGKNLAEQLNAVWPASPKFVMLLTDGLTANLDRLLRGLDSTLKTHVPFVGGKAAETTAWHNTFQYFNDQVLQDAVIAVLFSGDFVFDIGVSHGSRPVGITKEVTRSEANHIYEIDHRPAFEVFQEFLGPSAAELTNTKIAGVCLGTETPPEVRDVYEDVALRIPVVLDKNDNSFYIDGEWPAGTKLLICRRDPETIIRRANEIANQIKTRHNNQDPALVMNFNCAGRSATLIGEDTAKKEVAANQVFGKQVPWFGFYTFGEIAPIKDQNSYHNWTSVVLAIY